MSYFCNYEYLSDIPAEYIFDNCDFGLNDEQRAFLIEQFYKKYSWRQIGTKYRERFKYQIQWRISATWNEKYRPLFESLFLIDNSNFDTTFSKKHQFREDKSNSYKRYARQHGGETNSTAANSGEVQNQQESTKKADEGYQFSGAENEKKGSVAGKESTFSEGVSTSDNFSTDTPSTVTLAPQIKTAEKAGLSNITGEGAAYWNDGLLTEASRNNNSDRNVSNLATGSDNYETYRELDGGIHGFSEAGFKDKSLQNQKQATTSGTKDTKNNKIGTGTIAEGIKRDIQEGGFTNVQISDMLKNYRSTLEPFTRLWLAEFSHFFLETWI